MLTVNWWRRRPFSCSTLIAKLYLPVVGEQMVACGNTSNNSSGNVQGASIKSININQASESDLDALPGVGPVTAQKIIANTASL